jgi:hypothetical protein
MFKFLFLILIEESDTEGLSVCCAGAGNLSLLYNHVSHMSSLKKKKYGTNMLTDIALNVALYSYRMKKKHTHTMTLLCLYENKSEDMLNS